MVRVLRYPYLTGAACLCAISCGVARDLCVGKGLLGWSRVLLVCTFVLLGLCFALLSCRFFADELGVGVGFLLRVRRTPWHELASVGVLSCNSRRTYLYGLYQGSNGFLELLEQRPLDKISVVDIADHCGINRNTFYYYYCDVYALIRELMEVRAQQLITDNQEDLNWIEITREVTSFFRTHRRTVYHLFHSSQRDLLEDHIYDVTYACTESLVRRTAAGLSVSEADLRAVTLFFTSSLLGMISRWLRFGMKDDAEQLGERTGVLLEGTLRRMLERACSTGRDA